MLWLRLLAVKPGFTCLQGCKLVRTLQFSQISARIHWRTSSKQSPGTESPQIKPQTGLQGAENAPQVDNALNIDLSEGI